MEEGEQGVEEKIIAIFAVSRFAKKIVESQGSKWIQLGEVYKDKYGKNDVVDVRLPNGTVHRGLFLKFDIDIYKADRWESNIISPQAKLHEEGE
jgi:hypothetical protein